MSCEVTFHKIVRDGGWPYWHGQYHENVKLREGKPLHFFSSFTILATFKQTSTQKLDMFDDSQSQTTFCKNNYNKLTIKRLFTWRPGVWLWTASRSHLWFSVGLLKRPFLSACNQGRWSSPCSRKNWEQRDIDRQSYNKFHDKNDSNDTFRHSIWNPFPAKWTWFLARSSANKSHKLIIVVTPLPINNTWPI